MSSLFGRRDEKDPSFVLKMTKLACIAAIVMIALVRFILLD